MTVLPKCLKLAVAIKYRIDLFHRCVLGFEVLKSTTHRQWRRVWLRAIQPRTHTTPATSTLNSCYLYTFPYV